MLVLLLFSFVFCRIYREVDINAFFDKARALNTHLNIDRVNEVLDELRLELSNTAGFGGDTQDQGEEPDGEDIKDQDEEESKLSPQQSSDEFAYGTEPQENAPDEAQDDDYDSLPLDTAL